MPSDNGSQEPRQRDLKWRDFIGRLSAAELDRIADGEPYCFRCGKPAGSFEEYDYFEESEREVHGSRADYVKREEGTYNPETNRFACDACYIAIGMPVGGPGSDYGWRAP